ncbi:MAG TPA: GNAT family N-acetyltransferase [Bacilli bacterium]|nr:GNAT family N-acetyltransferase [Bacilli bacterium]
MNEYINITLENISNEHLCCAISDKKHEQGVLAKKEWLKDRIKEGHVFRKLNAQGKVFIEYAPLEKAWVPIEGNNYNYIYCLWVAGSYKNNGYGKELLEYAIKDAKDNNKNGICVLSSKKKKPFISEKSFFIKYGFEVIETLGDYELLCLSFNDKEKPKFTESVKLMSISDSGIIIYYTNQCPYVENCIKETNEYIEETKKDIRLIKIDSLEKAKNVPCIFNNWAVFNNQKFISNTLLNKNSVAKL